MKFNLEQELEKYEFELSTLLMLRKSEGDLRTNLLLRIKTTSDKIEEIKHILGELSADS